MSVAKRKVEEQNANNMDVLEVEESEVESALSTIGFKKEKDGRWTHEYFTPRFKIDADKPADIVLRLHRIFSDWGRRDQQKEIRRALGIKE